MQAGAPERSGEADAHAERSNADGEANGSSQADDEPHSLGEVLDEIEESADGGEVSVNDVLHSFDDRSTGVIITMLGLLAALPFIGAIPGISIATGALILLAVVREAFGGGPLRLPGKLGRLSLDKERFDRGIEKGRALTDKIDGVLRERLTFLTRGRPAKTLILATVAGLAVTMFPLAFVPWGVTAPAFGIVAFGLAMIARDGVFALVGYLMIAATAATAVLVL